MLADGRSGIRRADLLAVSIAQSHDVIRRDRVAFAIRHWLLGFVFGASLGHQVARQLAAALIERDPGLEQPLCRRANIAFQPRQDERRQQPTRKARRQGGHEGSEAAAPRGGGFLLRHRSVLLARALAMSSGTRACGAVFRPAFKFARCLLDEAGGELTDRADGFAIEHDAALDYRLGGGAQRPPDRRKEGWAQDQRGDADGDPSYRIAFEDVLDQSHSRLHYSAADGATHKLPTG